MKHIAINTSWVAGWLEERTRFITICLPQQGWLASIARIAKNNLDGLDSIHGSYDLQSFCAVFSDYNSSRLDGRELRRGPDKKAWSFWVLFLVRVKLFPRSCEN